MERRKGKSLEGVYETEGDNVEVEKVKRRANDGKCSNAAESLKRNKNRFWSMVNEVRALRWGGRCYCQ